MVERNPSAEQVFKALGDPTRLRMIEQLSVRPQTVGELAAPLDMSLAGASKHVGVLEKSGLVIREKRGRERICSMRPEALHAARDWVERYSVFWAERLGALEAALKEDDDD